MIEDREPARLYTMTGWRLGRRHSVELPSVEQALQEACDAILDGTWAPVSLVDNTGRIILDGAEFRRAIQARMNNPRQRRASTSDDGGERIERLYID